MDDNIFNDLPAYFEDCDGGAGKNEANNYQNKPTQKVMNPGQFLNHMAAAVDKKLAIIESSLAPKAFNEQKEDEDMKFLKSLYPIFLSLEPELKILCKRELLGLLLEYTHQTRT